MSRVLARQRRGAIEPKRALGLVPARYPVRDPRPEQALRERLQAVLPGATAR
ncbi:MAG: hypothetical protein ABR500_05940 [Dermatophilaceae bacterium]